MYVDSRVVASGQGPRRRNIVKLGKKEVWGKDLWMDPRRGHKV